MLPDAAESWLRRVEPWHIRDRATPSPQARQLDRFPPEDIQCAPQAHPAALASRYLCVVVWQRLGQLAGHPSTMLSFTFSPQCMRCELKKTQCVPVTGASLKAGLNLPSTEAGVPLKYKGFVHGVCGL